MRANGHDPCVVLQTSPGHLQAWIHLSTAPLPPVVATAASKQLAHLYGGDLASADWRHLGRLAHEAVAIYLKALHTLHATRRRARTISST
jgi:hypothetical protein